MPGQNGKGNPASHRMANPKLKERRARCWANGEKRKRENEAANVAAARTNDAIRQRGTLAERERQALATGHLSEWLTPHEGQRLKRRVNRDALRSANQLPPIGTTRAVWEKTRPAHATTKEN